MQVRLRAFCAVTWHLYPSVSSSERDGASLSSSDSPYMEYAGNAGKVPNMGLTLGQVPDGVISW